MADLVTRLRLDSKEFDDNIRKSEKELNALKDIQSAVTGSLKGIVTQIGAAAGVYEIFNTAINSNAKLQGEWQDTLGTAKESVDSFFTALATGDWTVFNSGILNAISLSKQYTVALRQLKMGMKIGDVRLSRDEKDLNKYENQMIDSSLSKDERDAAFEKFKESGKKAVAYIDNLSQFSNQKLNEMLSGKGIKPTDDIRQMIFDYLDPSTTGGQLLEKYEHLFDELKAAEKNYNNLSMNGAGGASLDSANERYQSARKALQDMAKANPEMMNARRLKMNFATDDELDSLLDLIDKIVGYEDRLETAKKQVYDGIKDYTEGGKTGGGLKIKTEVVPPTGSLAEIEKQIKDKKLELSLATDKKSRIALNRELDALEEKKRVIEFQYKYPNAPTVSKPSGSGLAVSASKPEAIKVPSNKDNKGLNKSTKSVNSYADALTNCASAIAAFNSAKLEDTGEGWAMWSSNLLGAAASTIIGLQSLTTAKGVNSAMDLPFPANLAAAALVLSTVISIFASLPSFASGGIFESNLTSGDKNIARLNGGEMILNRGQQYNLFRMLDNGAPTSSGGTVEFKISGQHLVGVLNNYNKKISKLK